nr:hypothetical protein [Tanacetum cinerariifolium]
MIEVVMGMVVVNGGRTDYVLVVTRYPVGSNPTLGMKVVEGRPDYKGSDYTVEPSTERNDEGESLNSSFFQSIDHDVPSVPDVSDWNPLRPSSPVQYSNGCVLCSINYETTSIETDGSSPSWSLTVSNYDDNPSPEYSNYMLSFSVSYWLEKTLGLSCVTNLYLV